MKLIKKIKKGFTLVELVVVIAVIAILAAVSVGAYFGVTESANEMKLKQEAEQIHLAMRVISLDGDPNQTLERDGLYIINNGEEMFNIQLRYETGWDDLKVLAGGSGPTNIQEKIVHLCESVTVNGKVHYTHFDYYTSEVMGKKIRVSINGNDAVIEDSELKIIYHECGIHTSDTSGSGHDTLLDCGHYACQEGDHSKAACGVVGHYNCDGKTTDHTTKSTCGADHYLCLCGDFTVPEGATLYLKDYNENTWQWDVVENGTYESGASLSCVELNQNDTYQYVLTTKDYEYLKGKGLDRMGSGYKIDEWRASPINYREITTIENMYDEIFNIPVTTVNTYCYLPNLEFIPNITKNLTSMSSLFSGCRNLKKIGNIRINSFIKNCSYAFHDCPELDLSNVYIPDDAEDITSMFEGCPQLEQFPKIPSKVKTISSVFKDCINAQGEVSLPSGIIYASQAFRNTKVTKVHIEDGFENINEKKLMTTSGSPLPTSGLFSAFENCVYLEEVNLSDKMISGYTSDLFKGCKSLKRFGHLPTSFGFSGVFEGCESLEQDIVFNYVENSTASVMDIFTNAKNLKGKITINIPDNSYPDIRDVFTGATINGSLKIEGTANLESKIEIVSSFANEEKSKISILSSQDTYIYDSGSDSFIKK